MIDYKNKRYIYRNGMKPMAVHNVVEEFGQVLISLWQKHNGDIYCVVHNNDGSTAIGYYSDYDLIEAPREHNLPTDIDMRWRWAAKDDDGDVYAYKTKPGFGVDVAGWWYAEGSSNAEVSALYPNALKDFEPGESLHKRTEDGGWEHVER